MCRGGTARSHRERSRARQDDRGDFPVSAPPRLSDHILSRVERGSARENFVPSLAERRGDFGQEPVTGFVVCDRSGDDCGGDTRRADGGKA
jgi:hypothetical protein